MNKNLMVTALLMAVVCQPVSAIPFFASGTAKSVAEQQQALRTFMGLSSLAIVGTTLLAIAGLKHLTKEKMWVEENCIKFEYRTLFGREKGSVCFKTPEAAAAAFQVIETGNYFGGFRRIQEVAKTQSKNPSFEWSPMSMTDADLDEKRYRKQKQFDRDLDRFVESMERNR